MNFGWKQVFTSRSTVLTIHIVPGMSVSLEVCTNKSDDWTLMDSKDDKNMIFLNIDPAP